MRTHLGVRQQGPRMTARVKLHPAWTWSPADSGEIELFSRVDHRRFAVRHASTDQLKDLFRLLENGVETQDLDDGLTAFPASSIVDGLVVRGIVLRVRDDQAQGQGRDVSEDEYFERQRRLLSLYDDAEVDSSARQRRLEESRIVVVGAGGWGSWSILNLSRMGFRDIVVFDDDRVELSNLNRQILFGVDDVGELKVHSIARRIESDTGGRCRVTAIAERFTGAADLAAIRTDSTVLLNPFGYFGGFFQKVAQAGHEAKIKTLNYGSNWVGPFTTHYGVTPCLDCGLSDPQIAGAVRRWDKAWGASSPATSGVISARPAANCAFACWELFQEVTGIRVPQTTNGIAMIDSFDYDRTRFYQITRSPHCATCGDAS